MNFVPVTVLTAETETSAVACCSPGSMQIIATLSHEELFYRELGQIRVQTFEKEEVLLISARDSTIVVHTPFYRHLTAFLFRAEVMTLVFIATCDGQEASLFTTESALCVCFEGLEEHFKHGEYCFQLENRILRINGLQFAIPTAERAQMLFSLLFYFKVVFQRANAVDESGSERAINVSSKSPQNTYNEIESGDLGLSLIYVEKDQFERFRQQILSAVAPTRNRPACAEEDGISGFVSRSSRPSSSGQCVGRANLKIAEKLIRSVTVEEYNYMASDRGSGIILDGSGEFEDLKRDFITLWGEERQFCPNSAENAAQAQQEAGIAEMQSECETTDILYNNNEYDSQNETPQSAALGSEDFCENSAKDDISASPEVCEEEFVAEEVDEDNFVKAVESLQYGVSCLNSRKKPTFLAFMVTTQVILQQKVFCGNQIVAGITGIKVADAVMDRQRFLLRSSGREQLEYYGSPEQVTSLKVNLETVLAGLARGLRPL